MTAKKETRGRKAAGDKSGQYQERRIITVDDSTARTMRELGKGNLSAGVRKAADIVETIRRKVDADV